MHYDPEYLLKRFTDHFKQKYKVECISALHHNKRKTNYHIHLIFAERQLLDKPVEKIATRNMFYDEMGKHRRTKKEILDEAGNIRKRCRVVRKGEMYERKLFTKKNELFKADGYLDEVKRVYTDLINTFAIKEEDKLHVFEKNGMYLAKGGLTQSGREQGIRRLMATNLMKRMESSVYAFRLTLVRIKDYIDKTIETITEFENTSYSQSMVLSDITNIHESEFDGDDMNDDVLTIGKKVRIDLADMDYKTWKHELEKDKEILDLLVCMIADITPAHDSKLQELFDVIDDKQEHPINVGNKKIIIFTAFADTADYLFETVGVYAKKKFGLDTALITGSVDGKTTIPGLKTDLNTVLTCFSPISKGKNLLLPNNTDEIDILIATDCISEGQNLQDCDYLINYDIHWNPVRIIQRFGRIDRIGSRNECIQLVNFWPDLTLDEYINLKARVETRMKIVDMTATGDDNVLSPEEKGDLEYRKQQLKRLQEEVVDIEEMSSGISIMDLGLNEFRLDLLDYMKTHHDVENAPYGMNAVVKGNDELPPGVIYVLRNVKNEVTRYEKYISLNRHHKRDR